MRGVGRRSIVILIAAVAAGCAAGPGTAPQPGGAALSAAPDSSRAPADTAGTVDYDAWFVEIHAELVGKTALLAQSAPDDPRLVEIRSITETAEEYYLEGRTLTAIRLLIEAEALLRNDP
jgi:hypothetical protein